MEIKLTGHRSVLTMNWLSAVNRVLHL